MSNAFSGLWLVELISQVNTQAKEALVIQSYWVFVNGMTHWISLIAGLEYEMDGGIENGMEQLVYAFTANLCNLECSI